MSQVPAFNTCWTSQFFPKRRKVLILQTSHALTALQSSSVVDSNDPKQNGVLGYLLLPLSNQNKQIRASRSILFGFPEILLTGSEGAKQHFISLNFTQLAKEGILNSSNLGTYISRFCILATKSGTKEKAKSPTLRVYDLIGEARQRINPYD